MANRTGREHDVRHLAPDPAALAELCRRRAIRRLSVFGSTARGENRPDSDIDLLVEFEPGATPGLLGMAAIEEELSTLLPARRVDLRTAEELSQHFRGEVVRTSKPLYAA